MRCASLALLVGGAVASVAAATTARRGEPLLSRINLARSGAPVEVVADRLEFAYDDRLLTYAGNVVVKQADIELRTDRLAIQLEGSDDLTLRSVVAEGRVVLTQGKRRATGGRTGFGQSEPTGVVSVDAVLEDGPNRVSGESIVVDLGLERSVVQGGKGRVQAILYPPTPSGDALELEGPEGPVGAAPESSDE